MQLLMPDVLALARDLSIGLLVAALGVGVFLWLFGWWSHRFWIVLTTTVLAGLYGLYESAVFHTHPVLSGLLLALCVGLLALSLVRILAFVAGGVVGLYAVQAMYPGLTHVVPCFLLCGMVGFLLFRLWLMILTSLSGCLLSVYAALTLLDQAGAIDAVDWAEQGTVIINWTCVGLTVLGVTVQYYLARRSQRKKEPEKKELRLKDSWDILNARSWSKKYRKAG